MSLPHAAFPVPGLVRTMFDAFRRWDNWLQAQGLSEDTRRVYRYYLLRFLADTMLDPFEVTEDDVTAYLASISSLGQAGQQILRALKSFYPWAQRRGMVEVNPVDELRFKSSRHRPVQALTEDEFRRVVIAAANVHEKRAWAIIFTLETGGRIGSVAAVRPADTGTSAGQMVHFRKAKNNRPYSVPLTPLAAEAVRGLLPHANGTLVGVRKNSLWRWFHDAAIQAGLPPSLRHPHILRDTFATNLFAHKRTNARVVQELLNHADLSQMHRYVAVTDPEKFEAMTTSSFG